MKKTHSNDEIRRKNPRIAAEQDNANNGLPPSALQRVIANRSLDTINRGVPLIDVWAPGGKFNRK